MTTIRAAHDGHLPDGEQTDNRASRREADRETRRAAKRPKKAQTGDAATATREAMRTSLLAQGFDPADVEAMLPPLAAPKNAYTVRQAVADAVTAMRQDLPRSEKTWAPYLQLLVDGLPDMCPCPCPACAVGPCPCPGGDDGHADACAMPDDELHTDCAARYTGVPDLRVTKMAAARWPTPPGGPSGAALSALRTATSSARRWAGRCWSAIAAAPASSSCRP